MTEDPRHDTGRERQEGYGRLAGAPGETLKDTRRTLSPPVSNHGIDELPALEETRPHVVSLARRHHQLGLSPELAVASRQLG